MEAISSGVHFFLEQSVVALQLLDTLLAFGQLGFQFAQRTVTQAGNLFQVVGAFGAFDLGASLLDLLLGALQPLNGRFLGFPTSVQFFGAFFQIRQFFFQAGQALFGGLILFLFQRFTLDFQLHDRTVYIHPMLAAWS